MIVNWCACCLVDMFVGVCVGVLVDVVRLVARLRVCLVVRVFDYLCSCVCLFCRLQLCVCCLFARLCVCLRA